MEEVLCDIKGHIILQKNISIAHGDGKLVVVRFDYNRIFSNQYIISIYLEGIYFGYLSISNKKDFRKLEDDVNEFAKKIKIKKIEELLYGRLLHISSLLVWDKTDEKKHVLFMIGLAELYFPTNWFILLPE